MGHNSWGLWELESNNNLRATGWASATSQPPHITFLQPPTSKASHIKRNRLLSQWQAEKPIPLVCAQSLQSFNHSQQLPKKNSIKIIPFIINNNIKASVPEAVPQWTCYSRSTWAGRNSRSLGSPLQEILKVEMFPMIVGSYSAARLMNNTDRQGGRRLGNSHSSAIGLSVSKEAWCCENTYICVCVCVTSRKFHKKIKFTFTYKMT